MFNTMNVKEMMDVIGGFYYVPKYKYGQYKGLTQVASNSGIKCYIWKNGRYVASNKYPWE